MKKNKSPKGGILRFYPFTKGFRFSFCLSAVALLFSIIANYMTPQVVRFTVDSVIGDTPFQLPTILVKWIEQAGGREFLQQNIILCAAAAVFFAVLSGIFDYIYRMRIAKASEGTAEQLRNKLFDHIQKLPFAWHDKHQTGDMIQRCTQDVNMLLNFIRSQLLEIIRTVLLLVVSLILMFMMNVKLSLIISAFLPILMLSSVVFFKLTGKKFLQADETEGELTAMAQENLTGVRVVRAFGRERFEIDRFRQKSHELADFWIGLSKLMSLNWGSGDLLAALQVLVSIISGIFFVVNGEITTGEYMTFFAYTSMIVWPARSLGRLLGELSKSEISSVRLLEILDAEEEKDCENPLTPDMDGDIVFDNVSFCYSGSQDVLKNVSFTIPAGSTFGVLGATGSGKSTLISLLDRLYELPENHGKITIGGVPVSQIKLTHLRKHIGVVLQEPFLFSKSFKEGIADGAQSAELSVVRHFAKLAVIDEAISSFSEGYETPIGERGVTISGGQKQRVAIARMLMQNTPIKIFDDSLSAVDMETDTKIRQSLQENVSGTTILIAHRITTLMNADRILVLDKGEVSQIGTHRELIAEDGIYKRIYDAQSASRNS
ncbi:ABC transporter ATP-binding protein [Scatolibacter rhodanostii]|uniref:ABC transporter ATP-binding protein n=1 Tax=Scatolibacter rhodanostii TaxID=2014781 RepID=UPI000C0781B9|nr:ABC transporter ATP-binding protein [Scatolibacter rhodanostii]